MEKKFIRVRSVKDIVLFISLIIVGCALAAIPNAVGVNFAGVILIIAGIIIAFSLRGIYKDVETGDKYQRKELLFKQEIKCVVFCRQ